VKCHYCGKEVLTPFQCTYCGRYFCGEHRLPENHRCAKLPKDPRFWYLKKKNIEKLLAQHGSGVCPKCYSLASEMVKYDAKTMTFECKECGHKWTQLKEFPHRIIETKEEQKVKAKVVKPKERKALRKIKNAFVGICLLSIIVVGIIAWFYPQAIMCAVINTNNVEDKIFELINEERVNRGLPKLIRDNALATAAKEWSQHMAETGTVEHGDFDNRMANLGYYAGCGEIIGMHNGWAISLARSFVDMWLNSQGHREIMLMPLSGCMGVGVSKSISGFYGVVDFHFNY